MKKQVEMSIQDGNGNEFVAYPKTHKEHVQFENGMNIDEFVGQDIATPTITHDTTAIKVGVGDSDVSSSVVDSTVNMTIKGQTYQNILPEPTLRNEMQGKSMQRLNEGYDNIEVVDGVSKSAILKGQTLVNVSKKEQTFTMRCTETSVNQVELVNNIFLKPNTKYFIKFDYDTNFNGETVTTNGFYLDGWHGNSYLVKKLWNISRSDSKGTFSQIVTTKDEEKNFKHNIHLTLWSGGNYEATVSNLIIAEYQEGMENWDIP